MGKGDKKTKRGKIIMGSSGVRRKRKRNRYVAPPAVKKVVKTEKEEAVKPKAEVKKTPVKKKTTAAKASVVKKTSKAKAVKKAEVKETPVKAEVKKTPAKTKAKPKTKEKASE